jgi:hypothetical protein
VKHRLSWQTRLAVRCGIVLALWLFIKLVIPLLLALLAWLGCLLWKVVCWGLIFWLVTALLPRPLGSFLRRALWWTVRLLARILGNLVS